MEKSFDLTIVPPLAHPPARQRLAAEFGRHGPWLLFILAFAWSMFYLWHATYLYQVALYEEPDIAWHIAQGHGFASPFSSSEAPPPSSWSPPVYPYLIALVYWGLGLKTPAALVALHVINALCYGAVASGLFVLGRRVFGTSAGLLAAGLFCAHPMFLRLTGRIWDHYLALAVFLWLVIAALHIARRPPTGGRLLALGAGLGGLVQINAGYVLAVPLIVLLALPKQTWGHLVKSIALSIVGFGLVLAPWTIRNYLTFDKLFFVRGGAAFETWFGNLPGQTGWLSSDTFGAHPGHDLEERRLLLEMGETKYFALCGQRFAEQTRNDPAGFLKRCVYRFGYLFLSSPTDPAHYPFMPDTRWHGIVVSRVVVNGGLALLGLAGAMVAWRGGWRAGWVLGLGLLATAPFIIASVWDRQTFPLRAMLVLLAGFFLAAVGQRLARGAWPRTQGKSVPVSLTQWIWPVLRWSVAAGGILYVLANLSLYDHVRIVDPVTQRPVTVRLADSGDESAAVFTIVDPHTQALRQVPRSQLLASADRQAGGLVEIGLLHIFEEARLPLLGAALAVYPLAILLATYRWQELLKALGVFLSRQRTAVLMLVGMFYNTFMPGSTGGDLLKAYYASKQTTYRTRAVLSVFVDRAVGMVGLLILGGIMAGFESLRLPADDPAGRACRKVAALSLILVAGLAAFLYVFYHPGIRRLLRFDALVARLPMQKQVHSVLQALEDYRQRRGLIFWAIGISIPIHCVVVLSAVFAGKALGLPLSVGYYFAAVPVIVLVGVLPIAPQGAGVMEFFAVLLTRRQGASVGEAFALAMCIRLVPMLWSLAGGLVVFRGGYHAAAEPTASSATPLSTPPAA